MIAKKRGNISLLLHILVTTQIMLVNQQSIRQKSTAGRDVLAHLLPDPARRRNAPRLSSLLHK
jgi:hypothetical protein